MDPINVKRIGKYEVLDILGRGGMGVVYKANDPAIGRLVAIKMITGGFAEDTDYLRRFYREAQSTGKLQHQNIVIVHDLGDQDGTPFLVMEYLEGESLQSIIKARRPMSLMDKLGLIIQSCNGLHYAHQRNIVHRDIKPANLMVLNDGLLKIVDFGIARRETDNITLPGQVIGTIQYMSPEQLNGITVDCRTDIFSTGVVFYQLLTHTLPFQGKDTGSTLLKIINEPPPPLHNFLDNYPRELDEIMHRALAKSRQDRYPTAEDFAVELCQVQDQLKRDIVSEYLKAAEELMARSELGKAKEQIFQILKVDRQNRRAGELLKHIQKLLDHQQRSEQARQLRSQAEEAIASRDLERALKYLEQAVQMDPQNAELQALHDHTAEEKARAEKVRDVLRRAESAHWVGDLDEALAKVEEALALDRDDAEAQALKSAILRDISERSRQLQIEGLVADAQRQISSRRFTDAISALQKAEALDPNAQAIKDLLALAASGREQELRRKEVEKLAGEIQEALNRDDYTIACQQAEEAAQRFPNEHTILKLQSLAERQKQIGERRKFVDEQISQARKLLESRQTEQAQETLESALKRFPTEPKLLSLLAAVRETVAQERAEARKQEYISRAKEALRRKDYAEATSILETARVELEAPEIEDLLQFIKDEAAAQSKRQVVEAAAQEAHRLISAGEYEDAIGFLEGAMQDVSDEELEILLADARRQLNDFNRRVSDAIATGERLLRAGHFIEAVRYLESQAETCGKSADFRAILERARSEQERMRAVAEALQQARAAMASQDYAAAAQAVEKCRQTVGDHPDLTNMAGEIDVHRREAATKAVSKAIADSRMLLLARSYQSAVELLDGVSPYIELIPREIRERYAMLHHEAWRGVERMREEAESKAPERPRDGAEEEQTDEQREWRAPSAAKVGASGRDRGHDLQELTQMAPECDRATDTATVMALSERAALIARRHPGDSEIQVLASEVADAADARARTIAMTSGIALPAEPPSDTGAPIESQAGNSGGWRAATATRLDRPEPLREAEPAAVIEPFDTKMPSWVEPPPMQVPGPVPVPPAPPAASVAPNETMETPLEDLQLDATVRAPRPEREVELGGHPVSRGPVLVTPPPRRQRHRAVLLAALSVVAVAVGLAIWHFVSKPSATAGKSSVVVKTTPEGATVRAGDAKCVTPNCNLQLAPGAYKIEASLPGYASQDAAVTVESGKVLPALSMVLKPLQPSLRINSNLTGGRAWLDGREVGSLVNGQLTLNNLEPGAHDVKVSGPDGETEFGFTVAPGRAPALSTPVRARDISALVVTALGGAAQVACNCNGTQKLDIDGHSAGNLSDAGRDLGTLGEGVHELRVGSGDETRTASLKLGPAPAVEAFLNAARNAGTLVVETGVDNADVFVNGKRYAKTAEGMQRISLDAAEYTVRVQKPGYQPVDPQKVQIRKNQETRLTFNLKPRVEKASFAFRGGPPGARVSIDGTSAGVVDQGGRFQSAGLMPGQHTLALDKEGYQSRSFALDLKPGETHQLSAAEVQLAKAAAPPPPPAPPAPRERTEANTPPPVNPAQRDWESVRNSPDARALRDYLAKYPNSPYTAEANSKIEALDWNQAKDSNDPKTLQAFLDRHPSGAFSDQARSRLQQSKADADRKAILNVLDRYKSAYEHGDIGLMTQIWPSMDKKKIKGLQTFFSSARDVRVELTNTNGPVIQGDRATLQSTFVVDYKLHDKAANPIAAHSSFEFRKKDGVWILDSVR